MFKKWQAVEQTVITSGCLQVVYLSGDNIEQKLNQPIKTYSEYLDIFIVFDGSLSLKVFNQKRTLGAGDIFFYTRSTYAEIKVESLTFSGARLRFIRDKIDSPSMQKRFAASMLDCDIAKQKIRHHCINFLRLIEPSGVQISEAQLNVLHQDSYEVLEVLRLMVDKQHQSLDIVEHELDDANIVVDAIDIFESQLKNTPKIKTIVEQLGVSHSYFVRTFKHHVGAPPNTFSRTLKVNCSLSLICLNQESLSDISYMLGFSDQSHFSNSFRDVLRFTPGSVGIWSIG